MTDTDMAIIEIFNISVLDISDRYSKEHKVKIIIINIIVYQIFLNNSYLL